MANARFMHRPRRDGNGLPKFRRESDLEVSPISGPRGP